MAALADSASTALPHIEYDACVLSGHTKLSAFIVAVQQSVSCSEYLGHTSPIETWERSPVQDGRLDGTRGGYVPSSPGILTAHSFHHYIRVLLDSS